MALLLTKQGGITLSFPPTNLESIYVRIGFTAIATGKAVAVQAIPYYSKEHFTSKEGKLDIKLPTNNPVGLLLPVEQQNVLEVHNAVLAYYESKGYTVTIIDLD